MIGWDLLYISRAPSTSCLWAQEKPAYELKVKRVQAHVMSTNLDLPTSQLLVSTRKGFQARSRIQCHFISPDPLKKKKRPKQGMQTFTYFIDLGARQGSIWSFRKAPH